MEYECLLGMEYLKQLTRETFGANYIINRVDNRHGGAQKVVYKISCSNGFVYMLYIWDLVNNYFQEEIEKLPDNERSYGCELFELNQGYLCKHGIHTPAIYYLNKERIIYPFDFALVEYVDGRDATHYLKADAAIKEEVFGRIGSMLAQMHSLQRSTYGNLLNRRNATGSCHAQELEHAELHLAYAAEHITAFKDNFIKLQEKINELAAGVERLEPYLIDIEGSMYYDLEYEHSFLEFRFGDAYSFLRNNELDRARMLFYKLHHHLSCTAGGLKLIHRGFPNQKLAKGIVEHNYRSSLKYIELASEDL
jgi:hypothetical protein